MPSTSTHSTRKSAVIIGVLFLVGLVTGIFSVVPVIDGTDYLAKSSTDVNQVLIGGSSQLLMIAAYVGIPIMLYPILSPSRKGLALGSAAFGIISGVFIMIGVIILLLLLKLSEDFAKVGSLNGSYFEILGGLLREGRDLINHVATTLTFVVAMFLFNFIFFQVKIVPRWLSLLGLIGSILSIAASLFFMLRLIGLDSTYMVLNFPIAIQQLILAIWLILRGFNRT
ncbi:DUF4386 domain-containing protein [Paenibacillus sp. N1-5-1-14]|uniref:DUF4386 domain-containing protein n=1 Tax=Paenibacillus radicibacter TaxID=2972488 RepID=UPI002158BA29|nr:DUF4386 domain-containing protein [Paenibacillus radicibacter]MCR8645462.1 DUF4386 domain-containing protein [Paenibacillus radicibacter]